jgi:hypothetical protein
MVYLSGVSGLRESLVNCSAPFYPGRVRPPHAPLARYRPTQLARAAAAYVRAETQPGDLVLDLFCQGPATIQDIVSSGRRAIGLSFNPLLLIAAELGLIARDPDAVKAGFTRLADDLKAGVPLHLYLSSLYETSCPSCGSQGLAEWFAWDRDGKYPFKKRVRCDRCNEPQEGPTDEADVKAARRIPARGLSYHYALNRVTPPGHPARDRAAELLDLYTPRNLSALMDLSRRLVEPAKKSSTKVALLAVLVDCLDECSSLDPADEARPRPRTLRAPTTYKERNVWLSFETSLMHLLDTWHKEREDQPPAGARSNGAVPVQADVGAVVSGAAEGYALAVCAARDAGEVIPPGSTPLVFVNPPYPDAVFWALSALWAGWLMDSGATSAMWPFLRRRRFDWEWHWRALQESLRAVAPLLARNGRVVSMFTEPDPMLLESTCLATAGAGYHLDGWGYSAEVGYRLVWSHRSGVASVPIGVSDLERHIVDVALEVPRTVAQKRHEPSALPLVHAAALFELSERGLLGHAAAIPESDVEPLTLVSKALEEALECSPGMTLSVGREDSDRVFSDAGGTPIFDATEEGALVPLADRIETVVVEMLPERSEWHVEDLVNEAFSAFSGPYTPELGLVLTIVDSYAVLEDGRLRIRAEDEARRRAAEVKALGEDLAGLGNRLGFAIAEDRGFDVGWVSDGQEEYLFWISSSACLWQYLLANRKGGTEATRCLVIPGGRAQLVSFKLQRDPRLAEWLTAGKWQFIKFRHVRRLVAQDDLDQHALKTVLGLDPIVERKDAQIPLF